MMLFFLIALIVIAVVIFFVVRARREPVPVAARPQDDFEEGVVSDPVPIDDFAHVPPAADEPGIRWTKQFEPRSGALSDDARLRLINDLGMLRAPWCVPLLQQAFEEETDPAHRVAAQLALARCREENPV